MRLVLIEWVDSFGCSSSWQELGEDYDVKPIVCRSVGWLFRDEPDSTVIVPHVAPMPDNAPQQGCGDMTIPTRAILRMVDLIESPSEAPTQAGSGRNTL